ncbi:hypothetical protein CBS147343_6375 [Aspergillus niger]|uniref:uncharacterized protein n=1 Tax=Aspergillus lacticoffeatus (strain CBS 101883) TaxID=1450533 RepID=UPI000D7F77F1|nr:uncharacterized protein BO96DRAFT_390834 [Aspergillus niger CBS 101883]KAI2829504.1 hypothetical protein CBS133816_4513 [Aspergillus niger]KAI2850346.1 hypothetical protein CBS11350_1648 [Aspergillus niger]KAI2864619.1 hypothetical protein CBS12448_2835 [Aspergillus niger]KAI2889993.1 hypothetical protein CBS11852_6605 [Aspergillus niger]KAI2925269.1 hypothetical protein CBS147371_827 [Aspergillus niger]
MSKTAPNPTSDQPGLEVSVADGLIVDHRQIQQQGLYYAGDGSDAPIPVLAEPGAGLDTKQETNVGEGSRSERRTLCGLRRRYLFLGIIVSLIVIAAAVGGGVGGSLASRKNSSSSTTNTSATPTTTTTSTSTSTSTNEACPASNGTTITVQGMEYTRLCGIDLCSSTNGCTEMTISDDTLKDFTTETLVKCIQQCESYNDVIRGSECQGVSWDANAPASSNHTHRCFLKNATSIRKSAPDGWTIMSAVRSA